MEAKREESVIVRPSWDEDNAVARFGKWEVRGTFSRGKVAV